MPFLRDVGAERRADPEVNPFVLLWSWGITAVTTIAGL